jgi:GT2 family glycosyltransferase
VTSLAVIIVSWNTRDLLRACVESIHASLAGAGIAYQIIVVDNASSDGTPAMLRAAYPEVELLEAGRNLGFAGGNNLALRRVLRGRARSHDSGVRSQDAQPDYLFLLNPDTVVQGEAIPALVRYLAEHPDVNVVGPRLRYGDGSVQSSRRRLPTPGVYVFESTPLEWRWPGNPWARRYRVTDRPNDVEQDVDWLVGAALMVRRAAVERAGVLDDGFALYSEELEWQRRIGPRIVYLPGAEVTHYEGRSSEQVPARRLIAFHTSRLRYITLAHGPALAAAVRGFLLLAYGAELAIEAAKWAAGHRRDLRSQRAGIYGALLRALVQTTPPPGTGRLPD